MRHPLPRTDEVRACAEFERRMLGTQHERASHPSRQVQNQTAVSFSDSLHDFAEKRRTAAGQAGPRVTDMNMEDGGAGGMRLESRLCNLRGSDGDMGVFTDRVGRAGHGAGDENLSGQPAVP